MKTKPKPTHFVPDTLMGGGDPEGEDSPEEIARLDALLQAELSSTKEQLEAWEVGQLQLLVEEYKLFTERIADLRNARMADLPDHFDGLMKTAQEQVTNIIERVAPMLKLKGVAVEKRHSGERTITVALMGG